MKKIFKVFIVIFIFLLVGNIFNCLLKPPSSKKGLDKYEAEAITQSIVSRLLKAPSTANFAPYNAWNSVVYSDGVIVKSYVDSQNSFGAMLRSNFTVIFKLHNSNTYDVIVYVDNQKTYSTTYKLGTYIIY